MYVQWKDGSANLVALNYLKDSFPVELADYALSEGISQEPVFAWWVPYVIRKRQHIIQKQKTKYWKRTHKYDTEVPKRGLRSSLLPIARRYRSDRMFDVKRLNGKFATDTVYLKKKSTVSKMASQVFSHKCGFSSVKNFTKVDGEQVGHALANFVYEYGLQEQLTFDGASVLKGSNTLFMKNIRLSEIRPKISRPYRPNENPTKGSIHHLKKKWYRIQHKTGTPDRVSNFGLKYASGIGNVTHNSSKYAYNGTPLEIITYITPDITEYLDFRLWDWFLFKA